MKYFKVLLSVASSLSTIHAWPLSSEDPQLQARQTALVTCLNTAKVPYSISTSSNWAGLVKPYNLRLQYVPAAITLPTTQQHVSDSVTCAAASNIKVQAKSGGHSYASFSSGGQNGSLIVDLQNFNSIVVDNSTFIATVGGGVRLGNLALSLWAQGKRALPHGSCPGVGIGGHFTHGGYGYASRKWGLALDTIVALDVVLANGTFVHATAAANAQIFFAMRGAADAIGIATLFYLQTVAAPENVVNWQVDLNSALTATAFTNGFLHLQNLVLTGGSSFDRNVSFGIYTDASSLSLSGWYFGPSYNTFNEVTLKAMLSGWPAPVSRTLTNMSWIDSLQNMADPDPLSQPLTGYSAHDTFYAKSIVTQNAEPISQAACMSFWEYVLSKGQSSPSIELWFTIINIYGGFDSQINVPPAGSSAYGDRDSLWVIQNYGSSESDPWNPAIEKFIDGLSTALTSAQPNGNFTAYLNYVDPELSATQAAQLYYGQDLYNELVVIKNAVDPKDVFWNPQAIGNEPSA